MITFTCCLLDLYIMLSTFLFETLLKFIKDLIHTEKDYTCIPLSLVAFI